MNNEVFFKFGGGMFFSEPREFTIEPLPNGLFRVWHSGPNMSSVHPTMDAAVAFCNAAHNRQNRAFTRA